ncbi:caspase [Elysia marginata]|uniref:Caspase n=1 Tax=Elysia marginata TaxID=1093978 RepID=A0AAV4ILT3_9GAST|nr:caspase [Elysia marginata]
MKTILRKFSQLRSLATVSSLAVAVLTHGGANDCLFGKDGQICRGQPVEGTFITKMDIIHIFKGSVCRAMKDKPKLFILQACRGEEENPVGEGETGASSGAAGLSNERPPHNFRQDAGPENVAPTSSIQTRSRSPLVGRTGAVADTSDMCFVHSSSYGYKAYRTRNLGSPFIAIFTEKVRQLARYEEFKEIIRKVQKHFNKGPLSNNKMTLPDFSVQLVNQWFLNPPRWANTL